MRKEQRLRRRKDFAAAYRKGHAHGNQLLVLRIRPNGSDVTRFGFVAGKAVGGAVVRNRVRRQLREIARALPMKPGLDIVIGARKASAMAPYVKLAASVRSLAKRAGALAESDEASEGAR